MHTYRSNVFALSISGFTEIILENIALSFYFAQVSHFVNIICCSNLAVVFIVTTVIALA